MKHHRLHIKEVSLVDIKQIAMRGFRYITENPNMVNGEKVYKITNEIGLYTLMELKQRFLN